ncbi:DUF721 domain-containing protein [bacterium]|nr:DUF721 domain-containing protein [bacterium]
MNRLSFEDPEPRSEKIQLAGSSVKALLDACGYTQKLDEQRAITLWGECITQIFGPEAIVAPSVKSVDRKELTVTVAKAAWRHRLTFELPKIIASMNDALGSKVIESIRLR